MPNARTPSPSSKLSPRSLSPAAIRRRLAGVGPEGFGGRAGWSTVVEILQLVSSVFVFIVLANLLTQGDYGILSAVLGVALPMASLSSFGSHILLVKRIAQGDDPASAWGRATSAGIIGPAVGAVLLIALRPFVLPDVNGWVFGLLVVSQVNFFWLTELAVFLGNATRRLKESAQIRFVVVGLRVLALIGFAVFGEGRLIWWAVASCVSFGVGAVCALVYVWRVFGIRPGLRQWSLAEAREGAPFSVNAVSESLVDVSDRPLLVRYGLDQDAGIYSLGARIVQFGYVPLRILLRASDADLFEAGKKGTRSALVVVRSLLKPGVAVGLLAGVGFLVLAPLVPLVASEYDAAVETIRLLAIMPVIRAVQYLMGNCLSATNHQWLRVRATLAAAALNFGLNLWLLPGGSWRTAVFTTIVSEVFLTVVLGSAVLLLAWREKPDRDRAGSAP